MTGIPTTISPPQHDRYVAAVCKLIRVSPTFFLLSSSLCLPFSHFLPHPHSLLLPHTPSYSLVPSLPHVPSLSLSFDYPFPNPQGFQGLSQLFRGIWRSVIFHFDDGLAFVINGTLWMGPPLIVVALGRERIFGFIARRFDRKRATLDGAVIASILDKTQIAVGQSWWIHHGKNNPAFHDHRANWQEGNVVAVSQKQFGVVTSVEEAEGKDRSFDSKKSSFLAKRTGPSSSTVSPMDSIKVHWIKSSRSALNSVELLEGARETLTLLEGADLTKELMSTNKSNSDDNAPSMVRSLKDKEKIDYFMSHSWSDAFADKWAAIESVKGTFEAKHGRLPTFWLDKVCIDQRNVDDGLKLLVINVMSCDKILVLCGKTYIHRLWCVLELFMIFCFADDSNEEEVFSRIQMVPIVEEGENEEDILDSFLDFKLEDAHVSCRTLGNRCD